jgi:acyl transferase domain-containing protein
MSNQIDQYKSRLREALGIINGLKSRVDSLEGTAREPIAIIGYGCRFPGGDGRDGFWQVLDKGIDTVREIPPDRWPADTFGDDRPEVRWAALLDNLRHFSPFHLEKRRA